MYTNVSGLPEFIFNAIANAETLPSTTSLSDIPVDVYLRIHEGMIPAAFRRDSMFKRARLGNTDVSDDVLLQNWEHMKRQDVAHVLWEIVCADVARRSLLFQNIATVKGPVFGPLTVKYNEDGEERTALVVTFGQLRTLLHYEHSTYTDALRAFRSSYEDIQRAWDFLHKQQAAWDFLHKQQAKRDAAALVEAARKELHNPALNITVDALCKLTGESKGRIRAMRADGSLDAYLEQRKQDESFKNQFDALLKA